MLTPGVGVTALAQRRCGKIRAKSWYRCELRTALCCTIGTLRWNIAPPWVVVHASVVRAKSFDENDVTRSAIAHQPGILAPAHVSSRTMPLPVLEMMQWKMEDAIDS